MISNFLFLTVSLLLLGFFYGVFVFLLKRTAGEWKTVKEAIKLTFGYLQVALGIIFLAGALLNDFGKVLFIVLEVGIGIYFFALLAGFFQERIIYNATFEVEGEEVFLLNDYGEKKLEENSNLLNTLKQEIKRLIIQKKISPDIVVFTDKFSFYPFNRERTLKFCVKDYVFGEVVYRIIHKINLSE